MREAVGQQHDDAALHLERTPTGLAADRAELPLQQPGVLRALGGLRQPGSDVLHAGSLAPADPLQAPATRTWP